MNTYLKWAAAAMSVLLPGLGVAQSSTPPADTTTAKRLGSVEVRGTLTPTSKTALSGEATASPASVTLVGRDYVAKQAVTSYGDLLRPLAGLNVTNYQLGGVGYGIQMRGYVGTEHARDIAFSIDGVPQNQGSDIQTNGYTDLNPLIPETLRRIEVVRGPNSPFYGDHALGGSIRFDTEDRLASSVTFSAGTYGTIRGVAIAGFGSRDFRKAGGYVALEENYSDAYRDNNRYQRLNGLAKYSFPLLAGTASVRAQVFSNAFGSANYLNRAAVDAGLLSRRAALDPTDGGNTNQQNLVFNYRGANDAAYWQATAYVQHHDFVRIRVNQPAKFGAPNGPQRREEGDRTWAGFDLRRTVQSTLFGLPAEYAGGIYFRGDNINTTRFVTVARREITQVQGRRVHTYTPAAYAQLQLKLTEQLKLTAGARYDLLFYDINSLALDTDYPNKNIQVHPAAFSPKVGLAYAITPGVGVFANYAQGFKGPSGYEEIIDNPGLGVSKLTSYEAGIAVDDATGRTHMLASVYRSTQTGEVQNDPVSGALLNYGRTLRQGVEVEARYRFGDNVGGLAVFGNYTHVLAELRNGDAQPMYVTTVPRDLATLGFDYTFGAANQAANQVTLSVYDQFIGRKYLVSDGSVQSPTFQRLSAKAIYIRPAWPNFRFFAETTIYPDGSHGLDEMSFVSGGVLLTAPQAKATFTAGVKIPF
ncbi:hypothetical protein A0257_06430 [Hymenobacter psoromatis]|nr:hypothetical protein A0257_06430 [Hymenobacter psoromatis]